MARTKRLMKASEIPAFVDRVIKAGCDICAIGDKGYVLGDVEEMASAADDLARIGEEFGDRDLLLPEIVAHLKSLGRHIDPESPIETWYGHRGNQRLH
ncbi:hypothetical protein MesoLj113a_38330 [Mesorhizobium sp. 113-1-2]|uniref:hypothetical protein n=1 Tax=Mesorhizobium sp. 113-1-2 TaxID=2744515 RepID=UPI001936CDA1|nr:hypothetical protein MesoLj113a_38330 [Mesorhizobium sp. 113-1-2]